MEADISIRKTTIILKITYLCCRGRDARIRLSLGNEVVALRCSTTVLSSDNPYTIENTRKPRLLLLPSAARRATQQSSALGRSETL